MEDTLKQIEDAYVAAIPSALKRMATSEKIAAVFIPYFAWEANYYSDEPELQIRDTKCLWESATLLSICVGKDGNLSLTYTFDWQRPEDGHQITVYLENWSTTGVSMDG